MYGDPEDPDFNPNDDGFNGYDIKMLAGYALIAWSVVVGVTVGAAYLVSLIKS